MKEIAVAPDDPNTVYVGDSSWVSAGVYRTSDAGKHWTRASVKTKDSTNMDYGWITTWGPSVECLAISPARPQRVAFGTSGHVFVSDDAGGRWQQRYQQTFDDGRFAGTGLEVTCARKVVPDPVQPGRLWYCYADIGLLRSDDAGRTFRRCHQGMKHSGNTFDVAIDPKKPNTLWAGAGQWATNVGDVCRSDDQGQTWSVVGQPDSGLPNARPTQLVLDLASPATSRRLLVTLVDHGLYETRDGGRSWQCVNNDLPAEAAKKPRGLHLDPADPRRLVLALGGTPDEGAGVWTSADNARTWTRLDTQSLFADITSLVVDPRQRDVMYVTARQTYDHAARRPYAGGLFVSRDGGRAWESLLAFRFVSSLAISPIDSRILYVATIDHPYHDAYPAEGVLKSIDGGRTWRHENSGMSHRGVQSITIDPHDPSLIYASTSGNSVFIGRDAAIAGRPAR